VKILIAGVGNVFLGDDGFGVEVARRLQLVALPSCVQVLDVGVRGMHLAYQLLEGYDLLLFVDIVARGGAPGTLYVVEPDDDPGVAAADAHSIELRSVLSFLKVLGGSVGRVLVVGCEPADLSERMGLSDAVERCVEPTVLRVRQLAEGAVHAN
jgi:hydrogenase maturation protease